MTGQAILRELTLGFDVSQWSQVLRPFRDLSCRRTVNDGTGGALIFVGGGGDKICASVSSIIDSSSSVREMMSSIANLFFLEITCV